MAVAARRTLGVRGAGVIDHANQRIVIETSDDAGAIQRLAQTVVAQSAGRRLTLGDVAEVQVGSAPPIGAALIDGQPGLQVIVWSQYGANTVKAAKAVNAALAGLNRELASQDVKVRGDLFRPTGLITTAVHNLTFALGIGGMLVIAVVFLFLWNLRMALIALTAIPLSLLSGTLALDTLGYSLNTMTLGGLGIAVGLLVDDAVIVVENVYRRLRLDRAVGASKPLAEVVADATFEVRSAVVYATLAIGLIFIPVLTIQDVAGRLFGPLGLAYILATLASLLVALTVTPALCSLLIRLDRLPAEEPKLTRRLKARYTRLLGATDRRLALVVAVIVGVSIAVFSLVPLLGTSFIPELKEGHYVLQMRLAPGSSIEASERVGREIAGAILKAPHVRLVAQRTGRAEQAADVFGSNSSELDIDLEPTDAAGQTQAEDAIRNALGQVPGATFSLKTFLTDRLDEVVSGDTAPVVIRMEGEDLDALDRAAAVVAGVAHDVPGAIDAHQVNPSGVPKLVISLRHDALVRWGFNALDVLDAVQAAYQGGTIGQVYEGNRVFEATLLLAPALRSRPENVGSLLLRTPDGAYVPVRDLADIREASGRYGVLHIGGRRQQTVTANTNDADVGAFTRRVEAKLKSLRLPSGVAVIVEGAAAAQAKSARTLLVNSLLAGAAWSFCCR